MEQRTFGKTGFQVSVLGFGAAPAAYLKADRDRITTMLNDLIDKGMNFIDTAASYPGSEEFLGDAISHLKKAAKLAPRSSRVFTLLGEAYLNSGNNAVAADNFKKALQLDPENTRARDGYNEASSKVPPPEDE